ncbi:MAG: VOC family protein [Pseudomonadota bacterium]|nr:VOC family protein [Pseudomonadota bacterium]
MKNLPPAAAVLYAKDMAKVGDFYTKVAGLCVTHEEQGHIVLESDAFQLVVVAVPRKLASTIHVAEPPQRRENTVVKLVFPVASIAAAREAAQAHGGQVDFPGREWLFQGSRVCDGQDPEGNVVQFRERAL